jgi:hypothetical protein
MKAKNLIMLLVALPGAMCWSIFGNQPAVPRFSVVPATNLRDGKGELAAFTENLESYSKLTVWGTT